ncbi:MAG TPA: XdhC family protein [Acidimicrobiales bacterium]|nr:XdhC family protein [Acidimicrobiales bacterium]
MRGDVAARADELRALRVPFVLAKVVLVERPTSAKPGDEAIVLADGTMEGFVGGTCAESTVRAQALALLDSRESLLMRITAVVDADHPGKLVVHNPCLSGGSLEIFLEPVVPAPRVVVVGDTPIARALASIGERLGYEMARGNHAAVGAAVPTDAQAVVVASHGRDEEAALIAALDAGVSYVGLVASRARGNAVVAALDVCAARKAAVHTPAGLDIGASTPEEIALSILAEIVASRPRPTGRAVPADGVGSTSTALDPVCGMQVAMVDASLHFDHGGARWWFCGSGCLRAFAASPDVYTT